MQARIVSQQVFPFHSIAFLVTVALEKLQKSWTREVERYLHKLTQLPLICSQKQH